MPNFYRNYGKKETRQEKDRDGDINTHIHTKTKSNTRETQCARQGEIRLLAILIVTL